MTNTTGRLARHHLRRVSITLSILAIAAILFLPMSHAFAVDKDIQGSGGISCQLPGMDHNDDPNGYAGGHCDMQSCSFCFPIPAFDYQRAEQVNKPKYAWLKTSIQFQKYTPLLRPPRLS